MQSATDDIVSGIMGRWAAAFSKLDARALASLYSKHAFFFGSNPSLYRGREGVAGLLQRPAAVAVARRSILRVRTAQVGSDVINIAGTASFFLCDGEPPLSVKMTWVIVREYVDWKIVSHHVSSKTPLIEPQAGCASADAVAAGA